MKSRHKLRDIVILLNLFMVSCSMVDNPPQVTVSPNKSGIAVTEIQTHGPMSLLGPSRDENGKPGTPDVPPGVTINLHRIHSLHTTEPGYFAAATGTLYVVSIVRYDEYATERNSVKTWQAILKSPEPIRSGFEGPSSTYSSLEEIPWKNAGRCFNAKARKRSFPWGKAALFLSTYSQGPIYGPVNNDMLVLVVQGLTNDGRYAVNAHFRIRHPKLPDSLDDDGNGRRFQFSIDDSEAAEKWLDSQNDNSFDPTIGQYERFLEAIQISPGKPYTKKDEQIAAADRL